MIYGITEQYHDYQPKLYFVDSKDLDPENPIDRLLLNAAGFAHVHYDAQNWESNYKWKSEPSVSEKAKREVGPATKLIHLTISFE